MITSSANPQVKKVIQLQKKARLRREEGVFLVEGPRMFAEVPRERLVKVYASESYARDPEHRRGLEEFPWEEVEDKVFRQMSDTQTPQGVLCIVRQSGSTMEEMLKKREAPFSDFGGYPGSGEPGDDLPDSGRGGGRWNLYEQGLCGHL